MDRVLDGVWRPLAATTRSLKPIGAAVWRRRRLRILALALAVALPLFGGGWLWLRHSSLVAVEHVRISGVHGPEAGAIEAALRSTAHGMSTLDVHAGALRAAVARFPGVEDVKATAGFPHSLKISVSERPPVAAVDVAGQRTAVGADGVVLGTTLASSGWLPTLIASTLPATGQKINEASLLEALAVLGAAPSSLAKDVTRAYSGPRGITAVMHGGLLVYFGDDTRPHAKWDSLARVLADPSSANATYVDVRVPERPAAGYPPGMAPASSASGEASAGTGTTGGSGGEAGVAQSGGESAQALAEGLSSAVGGGSSSNPSTSPSENSTSNSEPSSEKSEASGSATTESSSPERARGG